MNKKINYKLKISKRARCVRLEIRRSGKLVITLPQDLDFRFAGRFINQKSGWITDKLRYFNSVKDCVFLNTSRREYVKYKEKARALAEERVAYYNQFYNFDINIISIKNTKSRWGSCSKKGNLNFNYKIALLPLELVDYVIVHELCHLAEFNHSKRFWILVEMTIPNYKELRKQFIR